MQCLSTKVLTLSDKFIWPLFWTETAKDQPSLLPLKEVSKSNKLLKTTQKKLKFTQLKLTKASPKNF